MPHTPHIVQYNNLQTQPRGNQMSSTITRPTMQHMYNINYYLPKHPSKKKYSSIAPYASSSLAIFILSFHQILTAT